MLRTATIWLYLSAVALAMVLSERWFFVRAGAAGLWAAGTVGGIALTGARLGRAWRARRGWVWLRAGLCSRCSYPVHWSLLVCPECGGRVGSPPDGEAVAASRVG